MFLAHSGCTFQWREAALTIRGDDFHLFLFKGAPLFPKLQFNPCTQACQPPGEKTNA